MNYNGYKFDFACDPVITDQPSNKDTSQNQKEAWNGNADRQRYEARFWDNFKPDDEENIAGYGVNKPWIPPIKTPKSLIAIYDRWTLIRQLQSNPILVSLWSWILFMSTGDSWDGYWYNNAEAAGS